MNAIYPAGLPIALSLVAYNSLLTGIIAVVKRQDKIGLRYFVFALMVCLWGCGLSSMVNPDLSVSAAEAWGRFANIGALFIPSAWLHFVAAYIQKEKEQRKAIWLSYVITFAILPFTLSAHFIPFFAERVGIKHYPVPGSAYFAFTILFAVTVTYSFWILYFTWKKETSSGKAADFRLLFFAQLYGFVTGSLSFLPVYQIPLPQYNLLLMPLWQFFLAYAIIRHRMFDVSQIADAFQREKLAAIGTMAASLNHELRNPIFIMQGRVTSYLEKVDEGVYKTSEDQSKRAYEIFKILSAQLERASDIMQRFSDFARPFKDKRDHEKVIVRDLVEDCLKLVSHEFDAQKIKLTELPMNGVCISANRRQLEEVFVNLMINACHAMNEKGGTLAIRAIEGRGKVRVEIEDSGPGIAEENRAKIFEPFFTTKEEKGTGLGLYITKQLVERNNGKISVKSKLDRGASFLIEFRT